MKSYYGENTKYLKNYYKEKKETMSKEKRKEERDLIKEVARLEGIKLLKAIKGKKLYTLKEICEQFDFKYQYMIKVILKETSLKTFQIDAKVIKSIKTILKEELKEEEPEENEEIIIKDKVLKSSKEAQDYLKEKEVKVKIDDQLKNNMMKIESMSYYVTKEEVKKFIKNYFTIYYKESGKELLLELSEEGLEGVLENKWYSATSLMENLKLDYYMQLYRLIKKDGLFLKIIYNTNSQKRKEMARYMKM